MTFEQWKSGCNIIVIDKIGLSLNDMPDALWRDYYDDGLTPQQAVDSAVEDAWRDEPFITELFV